MNERDFDYYVRRAAEEEAAAARAADARSARLHRELSEKFAAVAAAKRSPNGDFTLA
jgi:hypothetical protein